MSVMTPFVVPATTAINRLNTRTRTKRRDSSQERIIPLPPKIVGSRIDTGLKPTEKPKPNILKMNTVQYEGGQSEDDETESKKENAIPRSLPPLPSRKGSALKKRPSEH